MAQLYGARPTDEVRLAIEAAPFVEQLRGELPGTNTLQELTQRHGVDLATMVFYRAILASCDHGSFVQAVGRREISPNHSGTFPKLLIIPALFYREHPEVGGGGEHVAEIARVCGIDVTIVPTLSRGSVSANARLLRDMLDTMDDDNIWLLSISKGGAEVRWLFQQYASDINLGRIRLWLNVCGLANGCQLVDHMFSDPIRRLKTRTLCTVSGVDYDGLKELTSMHSQIGGKFVFPAHLPIVNVIGVPLLSHVQRHLLSRYKRLQHLGPNDGMVLLREALCLPGQVYPLWGADHFFRSPETSPLLYRLFGYLLDTHASPDRPSGDQACVDEHGDGRIMHPSATTKGGSNDVLQDCSHARRLFIDQQRNRTG